MNKVNSKSGLSIIISIFATLAIALYFFLTAGNNEPKSKTVYLMNTYMVFETYGRNAENANADIEKLISDYDGLFAVNNEQSDISKINTHAGTFAEVSSETAKLISEACNLSEITNGMLDISVYPIVKAWGFTEEKYRVPSHDELGALLEYVDYSKINVSDGMVKIPEGMMVDLGAVAKGYACDKAVEILKSYNVKSSMLNLGGNVYCLGKNPEGRAWNVGIKSPFDDNSVIGYVTVSDKSVVTSGSYERYFEEDGVRYWHIMDPSTGYPADSGLRSVTIIADSSLYADALSTAIFVGGSEMAKRLQSARGDFEYVLVNSDNIIISSDNAGFSAVNKP